LDSTIGGSYRASLILHRNNIKNSTKTAHTDLIQG